MMELTEVFILTFRWLELYSSHRKVRMKTSVNSIIGTHGRRFVLFLGLLAGSLLAQGIRATLVGRITDESGAVIPRAKVKAVNIATNESRQVEAGDTGDFTLPQLGPGEYSLTVEQPGF